jgi:hypothetical protein
MALPGSPFSPAPRRPQEVLECALKPVAKPLVDCALCENALEDGEDKEFAALHARDDSQCTSRFHPDCWIGYIQDVFTGTLVMR